MESENHTPLDTIVYIDGLNLYYSLKNTSYKWLNIKTLIESVLDSSWHKITAIKYFTTRVQSTLKDPSKVADKTYIYELFKHFKKWK